MSSPFTVLLSSHSTWLDAVRDGDSFTANLGEPAHVQRGQGSNWCVFITPSAYRVLLNEINEAGYPQPAPQVEAWADDVIPF